MMRTLSRAGLAVAVLVATCFAQTNNAAVSNRHTIPPSEREALLALYAATNGDHWKNNEGWLGPPGTECDWYGVVCRQASARIWRVSTISLPENNLKGVVTSELGDLTQLEVLDLAENNLKGSVPSELGGLTQLKVLTLFSNPLSGKVPEVLVQRAQSGLLDLDAELSLLTDVSEIDYEISYPQLLCGRDRIVLRVGNDGQASVVWYKLRCRNSTPKDRATYCQIKKSGFYRGYFATLVWLLDKDGFYSLKKDYSPAVMVIDAGAKQQIRVKRNGQIYEVQSWGGEPLKLWTIERVIRSTAVDLDEDWVHAKRQSNCPRWDEGEIKESVAAK